MFATLALVLLGAAAPSCATTQTYPAVDSGLPKIAFEGDSITQLGTNAINDHYGPTHQVQIDAVIGATGPFMANSVAAAAALHPDAAVIEFGTNDVACTAVSGTCPGPYDPSWVEAYLNQFAAEMPSTTCTVFVTVNSHNPSWNPVGAAEINGYERTTFAHVADWDAAWQSSYFDKADTPHPNATGYQALFSVIDETINSCPNSPAS